MKKTIGVLAHVDAGKTTFCEQLLYETGSIRNLGRVDHKTSRLDTNEIEKRRGITIFADQESFYYGEDIYYLIDTPGHVDFSPETERAISVLDYCILLIGGTSGVQAHTATLFELLKAYHIPTFIFINKTDMEGFCLETIMEDISSKLSKDLFYLDSVLDIHPKNPSFKSVAGEKITEFAAERDEALMEAYLEGVHTPKALQKVLEELIKKQEAFPVMCGSALKGVGVNLFLEVFGLLTVTDYGQAQSNQDFVGKVYKIRHEENGGRITFVKGISGKLQVKDEFIFYVQGEVLKEKINEIRIYHGNKYESVNEADSGDVFGVTGLKTPVCGTLLQRSNLVDKSLGTKAASGLKQKMDEVDKHKNINNYRLIPALLSKINILDGTDNVVCMEKLRLLEGEDPMLSISLQEDTGELLVHVMGKIQLEVLEEVIKKRFFIDVIFEKPQVHYLETIGKTVLGYGHFEPLRHYAEVVLKLEPTPLGSGISFESECPIDTLGMNFQNLIKVHVFEKSHKGVLTGSSITDIRFALIDGRAHIKHTEGGDFREATYRAIRQGLEKAESVLLEPFYSFKIYVEAIYLGKVMADIIKMRGTFEPPIQSGKNVCIQGRGPVETFMEYSLELVSFTKGKGSISFVYDGYDICKNAEEVIKKIGYDKDRDLGNVAASVFCAKGTSFIVPWDEAENYMHTL